jgi:leucyl aminopeptidase
MTLALLGGFSATSQGKTVQILDNSVSIQKSDNLNVLYINDDVKVVADKNSNKSFFEDVYVVLTPNQEKFPKDLAIIGEVIDFKPNHIALVRLPQDSVEHVSGHLHHSGLACGVLTKLSGRPIHPEAATTPTPIIPVTTRDARVTSLANLATAANIEAVVTELSAMPTRHHGSETGRGVAEIMAQKYAALANGRQDVTISKYAHSGTGQDSLVVRIEGQDKALSSEVIVLGSHIDSISWMGSAPGADDNASGTATNLEIFRILMEQNIQLKRTLEIHGYAAEEIGLVGSAEIASDYRDRNINVVAMVQHDMNLWKASGAEDKIYFVTSNTENGFNGLLNSLAQHYSGLPTQSAALRGGSSDHASWTREGFAAAFPFENPSRYNNNIHTPNDTIANSGAFDQAAGFVKLGLGYIAHFGGIH